MSEAPPASPLSRRAVWSQAWPIILSQASVPLVGLVDTSVIGRQGDATALAAVALGVAIINFIFWSFGFLRMGTTGLTSQAAGAEDEVEVQANLLRAVAVGFAVGLALMLLQPLLLRLATSLLGASAEVEAGAQRYAQARFWGAPAALAVYSLNGWLLGLGRSGATLALQLVMNAANILLSLLFVLGLGWGVAGVGAGTAAAEGIALVFGGLLAARIIARSGGWQVEARRWARLVDGARLRRMFAVNGDIMLRTMALLGLFIWFADAGARQGEAALAANHILMQLLGVAAFVLDAFAFTAEARVGAAIGARSKDRFWRAVRLTGELALVSGALLALATWLGGEALIGWLSTEPEVRAIASRFLPFAASMAFVGALPWMLDGIFIGATRSGAMRDAALLTLALYIAIDLALRPYGNLGVWLAMSCSYLLRAGSLLIFVPGLLRALEEPPDDRPE